MTQQTHDLIVELLKLERDSYMRELLFLRHQRTLPKNHRKIEDDDEDLNKLIYSMEVGVEKVKQALDEIQTIP